jgi:hypothetical protein
VLKTNTDKFPPKKEGQCDGAVRAWVRQLIVAVDAAQLAGAQRKRADALLTKTLEEIGTNKN